MKKWIDTVSTKRWKVMDKLTWTILERFEDYCSAEAYLKELKELHPTTIYMIVWD